MFRAILPVFQRAPCIVARSYRRSKNSRVQQFDFGELPTHNKILREVRNLEQESEEGVEADFSKLHLSHREHETELNLRREQNKYYVVRKKYFRGEKQPNFLTWVSPIS